MNSAKFMWNGVKVEGKLYTAWYSNSRLTSHPEGTITIYAKEYGHFPAIEGFNVENDTDIMTDYFDKDRVRVAPSNPIYPEVLAALNLQVAHREKMAAKRGVL